MNKLLIALLACATTALWTVPTTALIRMHVRKRASLCVLPVLPSAEKISWQHRRSAKTNMNAHKKRERIEDVRDEFNEFREGGHEWRS